MPAALFTTTFLYLTGGLVIWGLRFVAAYAFTAIACARGWSAATFGGIGLAPLVVSAITALAIAASGLLLLHAGRGVRNAPADEGANTRFIHYVAGTVAALAILAMIWEVLPMYLIPICA
jgi:hypothetical protein